MGTNCGHEVWIGNIASGINALQIHMEKTYPGLSSKEWTGIAVGRIPM